MGNIRCKAKQLGQGMTEYIIIVALIAVAAIAVYNLFGDTVRSQVGDMAAELGGGSADKNAVTIGDNAKAAAAETESLSDFGDN